MPLPDLLLRSILLAALIALLLLAALYLTQRSMLYFPGPPLAAQPPPPVRALDLHTRDGLTLPAWFLPAATPAPTPGPAVLICNGNAGDRSGRLPLALALAERGYAVLLFDYRGYAGNPGRPSEAGLRADARAAAEALAARPEVDPTRVAYFGESLGAAVAGGLATERPPAALILRSPPSSIAEVGRHHYPYLPVVEPLLLDRYRLAEQLRAVRVPLLVLVAAQDEIVPPELSRRVFDAAPDPKRYARLAAADHNDPALLDGDELLAELTAFLGQYLDRPA
jgi:fermentation-respiration switch protein FrsA (DUF1100 family)